MVRHFPETRKRITGDEQELTSIEPQNQSPSPLLSQNSDEGAYQLPAPDLPVPVLNPINPRYGG